jgi:hypothetical protein
MLMSKKTLKEFERFFLRIIKKTRILLLRAYGTKTRSAVMVIKAPKTA